MQSGMIFSILRGSLYDGPGIRTTVFFKGCNLRCLWCHNPEGLTPEPQLAYRAHLCINCGHCVVLCPHHVHSFSNGCHHVDFSACSGCGICASQCPADALEVYGKRMTVEQVMSIVLQDRHYYQDSGGLTLSGGEPLLQPAFAQGLLIEAKHNGLHTCVETAGCLSFSSLESIAGLVDLFLFDYKSASAENHRKLTGADNAQILANLDRLYRKGAKIRLRCPIVPGCNDTEAHFQSIAALHRQYPLLDGIELMPYHDMGNSKAQAIGMKQTFSHSAATPEQQSYWHRLLQQAECL